MSDTDLSETDGRAGRQHPVAVRASHTAPVNFAVVGIDAPADCLEACRRLVDALPAATRMVYILVQDLDPDDESMKVELMADHTSMIVLPATDGMRLETEHLYVIPAGTYHAVRDGVLRLSAPDALNGARLPFDFLLQFLAKEYGPRAACVVLSGTGVDGCIGLRAVKEAGGFVIAQDPDEACYDGMPRNAIATGTVDCVAAIAGTLTQYDEQKVSARSHAHSRSQDFRQATVSDGDSLDQIINLLRSKTAQGFTVDKPGMLQWRIEGRIGVEGIGTGDMASYLEILVMTPQKCSLLTKDLPRIAKLEQELAAPRPELQSAIHTVERPGDRQKAINEEALSVNEKYQSTNEELLTSKRELQSLNEELTGLNGQLQEALERQRTTSNELQNVLYSTNIATLFLDPRLNIRFFTPATRTLFKLIPGDIGRPLSDLSPLAADDALLTDARTVLQSLLPIEREVETTQDTWFVRRILPCRTRDDEVAGVVITFTDISESKQIANALESVTRQAEFANASKSRFLAAASHDLRQPMQTLALLQGLLDKTVTDVSAHALVVRLDETLSTMSGMLNTLLDINQIQAGTVRAEIVSFRIGDLLERIKQEFTYQAHAQGLALRVVQCDLTIRSDPRLLEQMIRNLLSNALKCTMRGKVLLGCRRRKGALSIEIWDSGMGIPNADLQAVFEEYRLLDNPVRERSSGLGLGLSIVQRFAGLLEHRLRVRSAPGKGSAFAIEVRLAAPDLQCGSDAPKQAANSTPSLDLHRSGVILMVEDDTKVRDAMEMLLRDEGHHPVTAPDGVAALEWLAQETVRPDLILADYNLPRGMDGLQMVKKVRQKLHRDIPAIMLTGDVSTETLRVVAQQNCEQLIKPVKFEELANAIQRLLISSHIESRMTALHRGEATAASESPAVIFVVDDDSHVRSAIRSVLEDEGMQVEDFATFEGFLKAWRPGHRGCLILDANLPGMGRLELLSTLSKTGHRLPTIMIAGTSDVQMVVQAVKAGASDYIEKPVGRAELLDSVDRAIEHSQDSGKLMAWRESAVHHLASLTARQRQIMEMVLAGQPSKIIAANLAISQRTVENHRASIMKKTASKSLPALARLALAASWTDDDKQYARNELNEALAFTR